MPWSAQLRKVLRPVLALVLPSSYSQTVPQSPMLPKSSKLPQLAKHRDSNGPMAPGAAAAQRRWSESYSPRSRISPAFYLGLLSFLISVLALSHSLRPELYSTTLHTLLTTTHLHTHSTLRSPLTSAQKAALYLSPLIVGPRSLAPQYYNRGCSSTALLHALKTTRIRPDGASRTVNTTLPPTRLSLGDEFDFSFDLEGCPPLHLYTGAEACDLLQGFGGLFLRGDSFVRHVVNALFIVLRERSDGAVEREGERCRGNAMFDDRKAHCRENSVIDSQSLAEPICGGDAFLYFDMGAWGAQPQHLSLAVYEQWLNLRPAHKKMLSPVFVEGFGLHNRLDASTAVLGFIRPVLALSARLFPRPLSLWMGIHSPAPGKPAEWAEAQNAEHVLAYNDVIAEALEVLAPGEAVGERMMSEVSWFAATEGAESYDGSHYSQQVNLEKAIFLLNLLDVAWGEARDAGGLLRTY
ncbi:hypothetical protein BCR35DRAFT_299968 [Leucosporidium creatinivorum]|uniref:Uncharacterized protein n=1 Tax=Leucosporidium creatinivorum TaxID=106004 RepID=A0A1Y2FZM0_9BASI|nr:hypothetical protein BCR35DRAFT_299968 [Leucosporidium creatinivorum]